ncbi:MAG TPA: glycosyltransferase family 39 protein [Bryobacteraceae bacterium]|nr:glycosyltransferase family 39 protein [Bryobacteraceae bacterium]
MAVIAIGLLLRLRRAAAGFLNPDEAVIFLVVNQHRVADVWRSVMAHPYPPLYSVVLYFWSFVGASEFMLRLPSVLFGVGFLWFTFRWIKLAVAAAPALAALVILTFSPPAVVLSAEVRPYMLQLFSMSVALFFLARAFRERGALNIIWFTLWLWLSILSHYQAFWFALAAGVYALIRILHRDLPSDAVKTWAALQAATLALCLCLFRYHLAKFRGVWLERYGIDGWLRDSYFHAGTDRTAGFIVKTSQAFFAYFVNPAWLGAAAALLFATGVILLAWWGIRHRETSMAAFAFLLVFPLCCMCAAAWRQLYPYGGSRHDSFLFPFAAAGMAIPLAALARRKALPLILASLLLVPLWQSQAQDHRYDIEAANQRREFMQHAVQYLRDSALPGGIVFANRETGPLLEYYLGDRRPVPPRQAGDGFSERLIGGYRVVLTDLFSMSPGEFLTECARMRKRYGLKPDDPVWAIDAVFGPSVSYAFRNEYPELELQGLRDFGKNVAVFRVPNWPGATKTY